MNPDDGPVDDRTPLPDLPGIGGATAAAVACDAQADSIRVSRLSCASNARLWTTASSA